MGTPLVRQASHSLLLSFIFAVRPLMVRSPLVREVIVGKGFYKEDRRNYNGAQHEQIEPFCFGFARVHPVIRHHVTKQAQSEEGDTSEQCRE